MKKIILEPWEKELSNTHEKGEFKKSKNAKKDIDEFRALADSFADKRKNINIRISEQDLFKLKSKALREGISYQTYITSLIHKHIKM